MLGICLGRSDLLGVYDRSAMKARLWSLEPE
jgi:hypothetical protein